MTYRGGGNGYVECSRSCFVERPGCRGGALTQGSVDGRERSSARATSGPRRARVGLVNNPQNRFGRFWQVLPAPLLGSYSGEPGNRIKVIPRNAARLAAMSSGDANAPTCQKARCSSEAGCGSGTMLICRSSTRRWSATVPAWRVLSSPSTGPQPFREWGPGWRRTPAPDAIHAADRGTPRDEEGRDERFRLLGQAIRRAGARPEKHCACLKPSPFLRNLEIDKI